VNIITTITTALAPMALPIAVGMYEVAEGENYPDAFVVITPLDERNDDEADNEALTETAGADVNLYKRGNYQTAKDQMKSLLETAGFYCAYRSYVAYEKDTGHHHYVITVEKKEVL
jgi:hypothetical protein